MYLGEELELNDSHGILAPSQLEVMWVAVEDGGCQTCQATSR